MDLLITLVALEIIASKFLASYISSYRTVGAYQERNPVVRFALNKLKLDQDEWLSFFCTILLTGMCLYLLNSFYSERAFQSLFVVAGFYTTALNLGTAHSSYFQKNNFITRRL